jgi:hypothetical protein
MDIALCGMSRLGKPVAKSASCLIPAFAILINGRRARQSLCRA